MSFNDLGVKSCIVVHCLSFQIRFCNKLPESKTPFYCLIRRDALLNSTDRIV